MQQERSRSPAQEELRQATEDLQGNEREAEQQGSMQGSVCESDPSEDPDDDPDSSDSSSDDDSDSSEGHHGSRKKKKILVNFRKMNSDEGR
jgi:hypothetical protein